MPEKTIGFPDKSNIKEAVCIDAGRVFDSCCDRDCLEDLRCYFTAENQARIEQAINIRLRSAEVLKVDIGVEPVTFNKGFYACDLTFYFLCCFDLYLAPNTCPISINGIATFEKKVILFGSDGNVKVFSSRIHEDVDRPCDLTARRTSNMPRCVVQCVDPVALSCRICEIKDTYDVCCIPKPVCDFVGSEVVTSLPCGTPVVYVTLGLFTIIQLIRNVQMLVPVYDFCIPEKHCENTTDQPCDVFRRIKFPTDDFFPPDDNPDGGCGCGCS